MFLLENVCSLPQKPFLNITVYTYKRVVRSLIPRAESAGQTSLLPQWIYYLIKWGETSPDSSNRKIVTFWNVLTGVKHAESVAESFQLSFW